MFVNFSQIITMREPNHESAIADAIKLSAEYSACIALAPGSARHEI